jgi:hypothetical protein
MEAFRIAEATLDMLARESASEADGEPTSAA